MVIELHGCGLSGCRLPFDHVGHAPATNDDARLVGRAGLSRRQLRDRIEDGIRAMPWSERTMLEAVERAPVLAGICRNAVIEEWAAADRAGDEQARVRAALLAVCNSADRRQEHVVSTNTIRAILAGDQ